MGRKTTAAAALFGLASMIALAAGYNYYCSGCSQGSTQYEVAHNIAEWAYHTGVFDTNEAYWAIGATSSRSGVDFMVVDNLTGDIWQLNASADFDGTFDSDDVEQILASFGLAERKLRVIVSRRTGAIIGIVRGFLVDKALTGNGVCGRTCDYTNTQ